MCLGLKVCVYLFDEILKCKYFFYKKIVNVFFDIGN